jgi:hypothetical protein
VATTEHTTADETGVDETTTASTGTMQELLLGLLWLGTTLWTAHATLTGSGGDGAAGALGAAAEALPGLVAATLVTGAAIGHAAASRFHTALGRLLAGLGVGLVFGAAAAAGIRLAYGPESSVMVLALTVGLASVLGGALAVLPDAVLGAALWATTWVFFAGVIFGVWQSTLLKDVDPGRLALIQSVVTGLIAAFYAARSLGNEGRSLPWYLVAGGLPGLLLVAAEIVTRFGGGSVAAVVDGLPGEDAVPVELSDAAQLRHAVIVLGLGAILAVVGGLRQRVTVQD